MSMVRPCMEKQGPLIVAGLVGFFCDLMTEGTKARDKGGMRWSLRRNGSCFSHMDKLAKCLAWLMDRLEEGTHLSMMILGWTSHGWDQKEVLVEPSVGEPWSKRLMWWWYGWVTKFSRFIFMLGWGWPIVVVGLVCWTTWETWVIDIKLETWSMAVYCRDIMQGNLYRCHLWASNKECQGSGVVQVDLLVWYGDVLFMSPWGCCALEYNKVMDLVRIVSKLWSIPTTWRIDASCRDLWVETCMLVRVLVGDHSWNS